MNEIEMYRNGEVKAHFSFHGEAEAGATYE